MRWLTLSTSSRIWGWCYNNPRIKWPGGIVWGVLRQGPSLLPAGASVDGITSEHLGLDCGLPTADCLLLVIMTHSGHGATPP